MAGGGRPSALVSGTLPWAAEAVFPRPGCCEQPVCPCIAAEASPTPGSGDSTSPAVGMPSRAVAPTHGPSTDPTSSAPTSRGGLTPQWAQARVKDGRADEPPTMTCGAPMAVEPRGGHLWCALCASPTAPSFGTPDGSAPDPLSPGHLKMRLRGVSTTSPPPAPSFGTPCWCAPDPPAPGKLEPTRLEGTCSV